MTLFSSLYTGVTGMNAQAKATGIVANNVANINTTGFKRADTAFYEIYASSGTTNQSPGMGVMATRVARIDAQGGLRNSDSKLDAGITGNGFFPVRASPFDTNSRMLYTRAGQFGIVDVGNGEAYMQNANGFYLYGYRLDANGNTMGSGIDSLVPIQINPGLTEILVPTTSARLSMNLNANATDIDTHFRTAPYNQLPVSEQATLVGTTIVDNSAPAHFNRAIEMYDSNGRPASVMFEFRKIMGPGAHASTQTANLSGMDSLVGPKFPGINAGDSFTVNAGGASQQYIIGAPAGPGQVRIDTVGELLADINTKLGDGEVMEASLSANGRLTFYSSDPAGTISFTEDVGNPLTAGNAFNMQPDPVSGGLDYAADPANYPDQGDFPAIGANAGAQHYWEMRVLGPAGADGIRPEITKGLISFGSNGLLNVDGAPTLTLRAGALGGDFATDITVDMAGFSQYGGEYSVIHADQNGAPVGERTGIEIRRDGIVTATYSNGQTVGLYRIPLATFVNANGLTEVTGTVFAQSADSGEVTINFANEGGAGLINPATLENSNVDLGTEFSKMIVSQRAYSASSQLVRTVDEMTEYLAQLSR